MPTELSAEQQSYLERLAVPFHPDAINWRVTNKTRDGRRGCVIPYGDQRAYTDRLNQIVTPAGWTRTYVVTTLSPVTRVKKDKAIQTGKVIVTSQDFTFVEVDLKQTLTFPYNEVAQVSKNYGGKGIGGKRVNHKRNLIVGSVIVGVVIIVLAIALAKDKS